MKFIILFLSPPITFIVITAKGIFAWQIHLFSEKMLKSQLYDRLEHLPFFRAFLTVNEKKFPFELKPCGLKEDSSVT